MDFRPCRAALHERFTQALVVVADSRTVRVGRYDRIPGSGDPEVAFIVDDDCQHQGLGTLLADELVHAARPQGVTSFVADALAGREARRAVGDARRC